ncbi:MAG TPA: SDR family oxidoreductase [Bacteriovoracaceae bacterium]|nr:SDR family oxidoreductase [Bacteriovoracaceae bacterium]
MKNKLQNVLGIAGLAWATKFIYNEIKQRNYFTDKVALITGGSKGLGLTIAEELIKEGCRVNICARDRSGLEKAQKHLEEIGGEVHIHVCDVSNRQEVESVIDDIIRNQGQLDFLFNNAGIITVGSMESLSEKNYKEALDIMYWGMVNTTLSTLPYMKNQKRGQIINITSIGGEISVPHLLAYSAAKFAAMGFSRGTTSELRKDNIYVTTIVPGLMRTGSYVNAQFPEDEKDEFKIFSFLASTPGITVNPRRAARKILEATKERKAYQIIGFQAKALVNLTHLFPNLTSNVFSLVSSFLPYRDQSSYEEGKKITERYENAEVKLSHRFGKIAQERHQLRS